MDKNSLFPLPTLKKKSIFKEWLPVKNLPVGGIVLRLLSYYWRLFVLEYKEKIKYLAENQINEMFFNTDTEHAMIVLTELVKNAKNYVYIVGKNMDPAVTDNEDYLRAVEDFLKKENAKMKILLTNYDKEKFGNSKIGELLKKNKSPAIEIKHSQNKQVKSNDIPINFTVSDGRAYRFERDIDKHIAFGNFKDTETATVLTETFEQLFASEQCISVQF